MQHRDHLPLVEAFLVVDQPRQRLSYWARALAALDDPSAPPLANLGAFYDPSTDQALLGVRYDAAVLGELGLGFVIEVALLAEIGMIQPAELTEADRRRFLNERLQRCTIHVGDQRSVIGALTELARRVREAKAGARPTVLGSMPMRPPATPSARGLPSRGDTDDPVLLVTPKGTRDDLPPPQTAKSTRDFAPATGRRAPSLPPPLPPAFDPPRRARPAERPSISPNVIARSKDHVPTREISAVDAYRQATESMPAPRTARRARTPEQSSTERDLPLTSTPQPPGIIYARYLRSGRWVPIRIGALSLKGAALMSGALPRIDDHVDVVLSFGPHRALVRGNVCKVSTVQEMQLSGTATFSVTFELDDASRRQLTALLTAARAANVTIKPPPPRAARRFLVAWPVCLGTMRGALRGEANDVSRDGLFVQPNHPLTLDSTLNFSSVLDDGGAPVSGRARVVRHVTEVQARRAGLSPGYGLKIVEMGDADRERWLAFLARIEKRTELRVLVGASPARLDELQQVLAAAGYAVTGGSDPGALVELASSAQLPWTSPRARRKGRRFLPRSR